MDDTIGLILVGLLAGIIVMIGKDIIKKQTKKMVKKKTSNDEPFSGKKLSEGILKVNSKVLWAKDFASIFNLRKLAIIGVIIGVIYGVGWYKGRLGAPVEFDLHGKEAIIELNEHYLQITKEGNAYVLDSDGKTILKTIKVKDIPSLRKALRPFGFKLEPILVAGGSIGDKDGIKFEVGAGISWVKYYKWRLDSFLTNRGIYPLATSYMITENSGAGLGLGMGYRGDKRIMLYYKWRF